MDSENLQTGSNLKNKSEDLSIDQQNVIEKCLLLELDRNMLQTEMGESFSLSCKFNTSTNNRF